MQVWQSMLRKNKIIFIITPNQVQLVHKSLEIISRVILTTNDFHFTL